MFINQGAFMAPGSSIMLRVVLRVHPQQGCCRAHFQAPLGHTKQFWGATRQEAVRWGALLWGSETLCPAGGCTNNKVLWHTQEYSPGNTSRYWPCLRCQGRLKCLLPEGRVVVPPYRLSWMGFLGWRASSRLSEL